MATSAITGNSATTTAKDAASKTVTSRTSIANNFNTFLQLLTTQLQNQNPLDPLDTNQFTQQLVQFAGVEQQIQTNETLTALLSLSDVSRKSAAVGFMGADIVAEGATAPLTDSKAEWRLQAGAAAPNSYLVIKDEDGNEVYSQPVSLAEGENSFKWDGRTSEGGLAKDGFYTITVTGKDASGKGIAVTTDIKGKVDGVDFTSDDPVLSVGTLKVKMSEVKSIKRT